MNPVPRQLLLGSIAAVALVASGCGGASPTPSPSPTPEPVGIVVETTEFSFTPNELSVAGDEATTITLENKGIVEHDFTVDALELKIQVAIGKTASGTIKDAAPGTYEFYCSVPGHKQNGMVGTLTVE